MVIRSPKIEDAQGLIDLCVQADEETKFLARESGEFDFTLEKEEEIISAVVADENREWFVAICDGKIIGQASVEKVRNLSRYNHRASFGVVVLKEYWGFGVGSKLLNECIMLAMKNGYEQLELDVVEKNERAIGMYKKFGFKEYGEIPNAIKFQDGTYNNVKIMVKKL